MYNQQTDGFSQMISSFDSILSDPVLDQISQKGQEKLLILSKKPDQLEFLLNMIKKSLKHAQQVILRLKMLCLVQQLLIRQTLEENIEIIGSIIAVHERRLKQQDQSIMDHKEMNTYLQINVQLPYLNFLRKMIMWRLAEITADHASQLDIGFCLINKMKDIIALKKIFHHYGCYYPTHRYALNMFKASLSSIKKLWSQICFMVKDITFEALSANSVFAQEYLFICAAEEVQDMLMEYVYCSYFSKRINRQQKIKYIVLLRPQIRALELERKRSSSEQETMKCLMEKRDSRRSLDKDSEKRTGQSDNLDQKLNTEMQMQILDSILRLQSLLNQ